MCAYGELGLCFDVVYEIRIGNTIIVQLAKIVILFLFVFAELFFHQADALGQLFFDGLARGDVFCVVAPGNSSIFEDSLFTSAIGMPMCKRMT